MAVRKVSLQPARRIWASIVLAASGLCAVPASLAQQAPAFEPHPSQSNAYLEASWKALDDKQRTAIQDYLLRLGLSSTGAIQLVGVYQDDALGTIMHFQQLDLLGHRLFWSVLIDPSPLSARVLYHVDEKRIAQEFVEATSTSEATYELNEPSR